MNLNRRTALASIGGVAATGVGAGYWQRRRIRRWGAIDEFRSIADESSPAIEAATVVDDDHLREAYDRTTSRLSELVDEFGGDESDVEIARERIDEKRPDAVRAEDHTPSATDAARLDALGSYRYSRGVAVMSLASARRERSIWGDEEKTLNERRKSLADRLADVAIGPVGEAIGETIVATAAAEQLWGLASHDLEWVLSRLDEIPDYQTHSGTWKTIEQAAGKIDDAVAIVEDRDGTDYSEPLERAYHRLADRIATRRDEVDVHSQELRSSFSYASTVLWVRTEYRSVSVRWLSKPLEESSGGNIPSAEGSLSSAGEDAFDADSLSFAVQSYARLVPLWETVDAFNDVPGVSEWNELGYELGADGEELREEKRAAIATVEDVLERFPNDPLARRLCWHPLQRLQWGDSTLEELADDPRSYDDREWATDRDRAFLRYEEARRYAEAIPDSLALVYE